MYRLGLAHSFHVCIYFSFFIFSVYFCTIFIFIIIIIIIIHVQYNMPCDNAYQLQNREVMLYRSCLAINVLIGQLVLFIYL